uniref:Uncharacterized protein n=1 Tax=Anopheles stephensi TaxID=30069 RepID=A0A182YKU7_ANOST
MEYVAFLACGCLYEGRHIDSGTEWTDPEDPCMHYKCVSGVVTRSEMKCYAPCSDPSPPRKGQCCPTCLDGKHRDHLMIDVRYDSHAICRKPNGHGRIIHLMAFSLNGHSL